MTGAEELPSKALTLYQPYAWLVVNGYKPIENRPEGFSQKNFRGPFWVHAGLEQRDDVWQQARWLCNSFIGRDFKLPTFDELPLGCVVGSSNIVGVHYPRTSWLSPRFPVAWHFHDQYGLILAGTKKLERPVACRGMQGFWPVPADVFTSLKEQVLACA